MRRVKDRVIQRLELCHAHVSAPAAASAAHRREWRLKRNNY